MAYSHFSASQLHERQFNEKFPTSIVTFLAICQMLATFAIIATEIAHIVINWRLTNLFVGFWASIFFTVLWISMFISVCCCRRRSCAAHAAFQNLLSLVLAFILIGINILFLNQPDRCFLPDHICQNFNWISISTNQHNCAISHNPSECDQLRLDLIRGQLTVGIILAITCTLYLLIFVFVNLQVKDRRNQVARAVMVPVVQTVATNQLAYTNNPYAPPVHLQTVSPPTLVPSAPIQVPMEINNAVPVANINSYTPMYPKLPDGRF